MTQTKIQTFTYMYDLFQTECSYKHPDLFYNSEKLQSEASLHMLTLNSRSIPHNLESLLTLLGAYLDKLQILCLTETWHNHRTVDLYNITGFKAINNYRKNKRGGGVGIYIKDDIPFLPLKKFTKSTADIDTLFVKINKNFTKTDRSIIIGVCYRPPPGDIQHYNTSLYEILDNVNHDNNYIYLHGDFNINLFNLNKSAHMQDFYNLLQSFSLYPLYNPASSTMSLLTIYVFITTILLLFLISQITFLYLP